MFRSFIENDLWDQARVIQTGHELDEGISSPIFNGKLVKTYAISNDKVLIINNLKLKERLMC